MMMAPTRPMGSAWVTYLRKHGSTPLIRKESRKEYLDMGMVFMQGKHSVQRSSENYNSTARRP
jgi:hypothetical protein